MGALPHDDAPAGSRLQPVAARDQRMREQPQPDVHGGDRERADHDRAVGMAGKAEAQAVDQIVERIEVRRDEERPRLLGDRLEGAGQ